MFNVHTYVPSKYISITVLSTTTFQALYGHGWRSSVPVQCMCAPYIYQVDVRGSTTEYWCNRMYPVSASRGGLVVISSILDTCVVDRMNSAY